MGELLARNKLDADSIVSCIFTLTETSTRSSRRSPRARSASAACRSSARARSPSPGALPRVIRVLMHCYPPVGVDPQHVYLGEARKLRLDLEGAQ